MEFIVTIKRLEEVAAANLGPMDQGTYASFFQQAKTIAGEQGIEHVCLIIDFKLKKPNELGLVEQFLQLGPIEPENWDNFLSSALDIVEYMPRIFVVDRRRYTAGD